MSSTGGIILLVLGGALIYFLYKGGKLPNITNNGIVQNPNGTTSIQGSVTPSIVETLQKSIPNLSGSQVSNLIHGGSIGGYRGTNGKLYSSYEEAKANGAA